jgi:hypothetical protein
LPDARILKLRREIIGMNEHQSASNDSGERRPKNKANMDQPQEEFIEAESSHADRDKDHGDELQYASHSASWRNEQ